MRRVLLGLGFVCAFVGAYLGVERVKTHARTERTSLSMARTLDEPGELMRESLAFGQRVVFEACSVEQDAFDERFVDRVIFEVVVVPEDDVALRVSTDAERIARARRSRRGVCIDLGKAERLGGSGVFAITLAPSGEVPHALSHMPIVARIVATTPVSDADFLPVMLALIGSFLLLCGMSGAEPAPVSSEAMNVGRAYGLVVFATLLVVLSLFVGEALPRVGPLTALMSAGLIAFVELVCVIGVPAALFLPVSSVLSLDVRPSWRWLAAAPCVAAGLYVAGRSLARVVPSTGESPIETLVSSTGGFVVVALVAVLVPLVEELFFRGLLYGLLARAKSERVAAIVSFLLFVLVHLPQVYGAWSALLSIALTGLALVWLRYASGSVLVPALAHLVHNGVITVLGFVTQV